MTHIVTIVDTACYCHDYWSGGLAYDGWVNVAAIQLNTMKKIKPNDPANSYVWRKINNTHLVAGGEGCSMPKDCEEDPDLLPSSVRNLILDWINEGALDN